MNHFCRMLPVFLLMVQFAPAEEIYVNNATGHDSNDGLIAVGRQGGSGPVRTLARAAQLAGPSDAIILSDTGTPYYDSLSLTGYRHSGFPNAPFVIIGNGATISGLRSVPPEGWQRVKPGLWKLTLTRKGFYQLLRNGQTLVEYRPDEGIDPLTTLPTGQWVAWKGSIYVKQDGIATPDTQAFAVTSDQTGISLHRVKNVLIVDLNLEHFRFDGLHAQGLCDNIELQNVNATENGRAGIVASGASQIEIFGGTVERNGRHQIMAQNKSTATKHDLVQRNGEQTE